MFSKKKEKSFDFAFLLHPRNLHDIQKTFPITQILPDAVLLRIFNMLPPIKVATITGLHDENGVEKRGIILSIPLTAEQMLTERGRAKKQVIRGIKKAKKKGALHVGLGAFTSVVTSGGLDVKGVVPGVHVTNGNALTAHVAFEGLMDLFKKHKLEKPHITIIGATGSIGHAVTELIIEHGEYFSKISIVGKTPSKIQTLKEKISSHLHASKVFSESLEVALPSSDIIFSATSAHGAVISPELIKRGTIIYDITQPKNIHPDLLIKKDVLIYDGGVVHLPKGVHVCGYVGLPHGRVFACMAETILLSLSAYPDDFCLGNVSTEQVSYIKKYAKDFHFKSSYQQLKSLY